MTGHPRPWRRRLGLWSRGPADPDQRLITQVWRRIAAQTAVVFAVAIFVLGGLAAVLVTSNVHADARARVAQALDDPDALSAPPPGIRVYRREDGVTRSNPGAPHDPVDPVALDRVTAGGTDRVHEVQIGRREYLVDTRRTGQRTVQVALDLAEGQGDLRRLYLALAAAGAAGLGVAALVGAVIARRAIAPLGQALAAQRRFVADASHELRTPLTQLHTRAQLLDRGYRADADPQRVAADIAALVRGTRQLGELVEELLLVTQLSHEPQRFGPVDLAELASEVVKADLVRAQQRQVELRTVHDPGDHLVRGAVPALRRVLTSLLDNALGHTPAGGHIDVEIGVALDGGSVRCTVRDDGVGFDPAEAQRIFERFARGHQGKGRRFGIGLALVREVVRAHGGTVEAEARPGQGAAFTIILPAWRPPHDAAPR